MKSEPIPGEAPVARSRGNPMDFLIPLAFLVAWIVLQAWVLPRFGVKT